MSGVSAWLEADDLRPVAAALVKHMKTEQSILQLPKSVSARHMILEHIEQFDEIKPTKFDGSVWKLVEWIETSDTGKSLNLNLDFRPH